MNDEFMIPPGNDGDQSDEALDAMLADAEDWLLAAIYGRLDLEAGLAEITGNPLHRPAAGEAAIVAAIEDNRSTTPASSSVPSAPLCPSVPDLGAYTAEYRYVAHRGKSPHPHVAVPRTRKDATTANLSPRHARKRPRGKKEKVSALTMAGALLIALFVCTFSLRPHEPFSSSAGRPVSESAAKGQTPHDGATRPAPSPAPPGTAVEPLPGPSLSFSSPSADAGSSCSDSAKSEIVCRVTFDPGQYRLSDNAKFRLRWWLKHVAASMTKITITGFEDRDGTGANPELAAARAQAIATYLEAQRIPASQIKITDESSANPAVEPNIGADVSAS